MGERVKWARTQRKLSQKQLAERAGVSTGMIGNLESGARDRPRELVAIARALDATVDWLDRGEGEWEARPTLDSSVEELFVQLAGDWDVQVMKLRPQDALRLPAWLTGAFGKGPYVPDFEMFVPGREAPVWIECKGPAVFFGERSIERYREIERIHPSEFALYQPHPNAVFMGVASLMQRFGAKPKRDVVDVDSTRDFDLPSFSKEDPEDELPRFSRAAEARPAYPTMQPILSWQHEDELPDGEFVMVPRLQVHLSAGGGAGTSQVEIQFDEAQPQAFRAEWVRSQHLKPKKLAAMTARGDSMEPTIHDGDSLLVDTGQVEVLDGKVYALWWDGGERVKRLYRMPGGGLRIRSDNATDFPEIVLGPEHPGHVRIIGRVVHRSGTGGL